MVITYSAITRSLVDGRWLYGLAYVFSIGWWSSRRTATLDIVVRGPSGSLVAANRCPGHFGALMSGDESCHYAMIAQKNKHVWLIVRDDQYYDFSSACSLALELWVSGKDGHTGDLRLHSELCVWLLDLQRVRGRSTLERQECLPSSRQGLFLV